MTSHQIKLVARYAFKDHEPDSLGYAIAETIKAFALPKEVEYFDESMLIGSIKAMLVAKGELDA